MEEPRVEMALLRRRTPAAWTDLLQSQLALPDVAVTAVSAMPLNRDSQLKYGRHVMRYILSLDGHTDPISLIAKYTSREEASFYQHLAVHLPRIAPKCYFIHQFNQEGWLILEDVPNHFPPHKWTPEDVHGIVNDLSTLHSRFWQEEETLGALGFEHIIEGKKYTWQELRRKFSIFFEDGPGSIVSQHAINSSGKLAPLLLQAANGLSVLQSLGGWPGILSESHLTAVSDLLDDPLPMLKPLLGLPNTLLHGDPHAYHWRSTLFNERRLIDWRNVKIGASILDLVGFLEQFDLLYLDPNRSQMSVRSEWPISEETIIDSYLLEMSTAVSGFDARATRLAIPAARCLYIITNWFPYFATWFSEMPNKYTWQRVNRIPDDQLTDSKFHPVVRFRPYLSGVFERFMLAFRSL